MSRPPFGDPGSGPTIALFSYTTNQSPFGGSFSTAYFRLRAGLKIQRGSAARDFGRGQGGEARASPWRAARAEATPPGGFSRKGRSGGVAPRSPTHCRVGSLVAPCQTGLSAKTEPL